MARLSVTKDEYMNDQMAFEMAMHRVQNQARNRGQNPTFGELLHLAKADLSREYDQAVALAAPLPEDAS
jgi:hypothetical protein